ncbi:MAG: translation initiation factor IF-3 [Bacilli bacterium]
MSFYIYWRCFIAKQEGNLINEKIRCRTVIVIGPKGEKLGEKSKNDALKLAEVSGFDLVLMNENPSGIGICKLMDYNKYNYERKRKQKESKKIQRSKNVETKEFRVSHKIDVNDFETKLKNARKAIEKGNKVKLTMRFYGREIIHNELGKVVLKKFADALNDIAVIESRAKMEGRSMVMLLSPEKK